MKGRLPSMGEEEVFLGRQSKLATMTLSTIPEAVMHDLMIWSRYGL